MSMIEMTALGLGRKIAQREISVREAAQAVLGQIDAVDDTIHAYITINEEALFQRAKTVQQKIDSGAICSPLAGVPVSIKDNICVKDMLTTCGSRILENFIPPYSAEAVRKLSDAGAVILGKTNMDEFGMGNTTETSAYGATRNPWNTNHVPGGSSGGACAAAAAGECFYALGSDTGGSIRQPSAFCGVTGLKPTYGTVSRYGLVAYASSLEQIGPIARDVSDCAAVLETIAGYDPKDSTSVRRKDGDFTSALAEDVRGMRIGIPQDFLDDETGEEIKSAVWAAVRQLEESGASTEVFNLGLTEFMVPAYYIIASAEASSNLARFDGVRYGRRAPEYTDLNDMYQRSRSEGFGTEVKRRIMLGSYVLSTEYYEAYYHKALQTKGLIKQAFDNAFKRYDVILAPAAPHTAPLVGAAAQDVMKTYMSDVHTVAVNLAGLPALSLPGAIDSGGLPVGIQLIGAPFQEKKIIRTGFTLEKMRNFNNNIITKIKERAER